MKIKRFVFGFLILSLLSCNYVTQMIFPPTATPLPTLTPTASATPTPVPLVPAFIPDECASVPLATIPPESALAQPTLEVEANADVSQSEQEKILDELAKIVEDVYVYPDFNGKDWKAIEAKYRAMIEAGLDTESFYREMQAMIEELQDEHSFFLSPLEARQSEAELRGEGEFVGVGIYSQPDLERQRLIVISTFAGSPADHAGIQPHDSILLVDGVPLELETGNRLRGPACTAVVVTVQSPGEEPRELMLVRQAIQGGLDIDAAPRSDHRWIEDRLYLHPHLL